MKNFADREKTLLEFFETEEYIEEAVKLLERYGTTEKIPEEKFNVRDLKNLRLKCFCIEVEKRRKRAH